MLHSEIAQRTPNTSTPIVRIGSERDELVSTGKSTNGSESERLMAVTLPL